MTIATAASNNLGETISYDVMGNIQALDREGYGITSYTGYTGNRLTATTGAYAGTFSYDANGNVKTDSRRLITNIDYNYLNLPETVTGPVNLSYTYDAGGRKLRKVGAWGTIDYVDGIQYKPDGTIDFIQTEEGIARNNGGGYSYEYNLTDHLGNVRTTFRENPNPPYGIEMIQRDDYYAFGLRKSPVVKPGTNSYLYNGKELQEELDQYDYGARFYDPVIGRFNVVDAKAEHPFQISTSPYAYTGNNPISRIDPDGNCWPCLVYEAIAALTTTEIVATGVIAAGLTYTVVNGYNNYSKNNASVQDNTSVNLDLKNRPGLLKTEESSESTESEDGLQGGTRLPEGKIKSPPAKRGNAPVGDDDNPVELHHREQTPDGPIDEKTRTDHRGGENYKKNHPNTGETKSKIDRGAFKTQRRKYWESEWDKGRWKFNSDGTKKN